MDIYDAIIVGAGPAGGSAAFFLGQAGQRVLVLEKESLPRYKTCGGGLSEDVLKQFPFSFEPVLERRVSAVRYNLDGQSVRIPIPGHSMCMVMRGRFDHFLLQHTRAEVRQNSPVKWVHEEPDRVLVETNRGETFAGRFLIGADGANSVAAHCLGLRKQRILAAAIEVEAQVPPEVLAQFAEQPLLILGRVPHGYIWVFPKADHLSIGVGSLRPKPGELQQTLKQEVAPYGISLDGSIIHGHPVPVFRRWERVMTRRVLLAGDAAGLVDPFTGEGIRFAIQSGRLAAEAILCGRPASYAPQVNRQIRLSLTVGAILAETFFAFPKTWFELAVKNPYATQAFVEMVSGRSNYLKIALMLVGTLPLHLIRKLFHSYLQ